MEILKKRNRSIWAEFYWRQSTYAKFLQTLACNV